jgi:hypothetical protein
MGTFPFTIQHLWSNVLDAAREYSRAEAKLSQAEATGAWDKEGLTAKRKAAELAIAIDGLSDRAHCESSLTVEVIRKDVSALCYWPRSQDLRPQALERVQSVANAYKHYHLDNKRTNVIDSFDDVLTVGLGYGLDGYGVGKYEGVEVLVRDKTGKLWKFQGDAPTVICAWLRYLKDNGGCMPLDPLEVCGVRVYP